MMPRVFVFESCLAPYLQGLIEEKHACGKLYDTEGLILKRFDKYCIEHELSGTTVTREFLNEWMKRRNNEGEMYCAKRTSVVKQLLNYMASLGKDVYLPSNYCHFPVHLTHILDAGEIQDFFYTLDHYQTGHSKAFSSRLMMEYRALFRLIYCLGLRNNEAAGIAMNNVDLINGSLTINCSKGYKDRIVYMPEDLTEMLRTYYSKLTIILGYEPKWLFPSSNPEKPIRNTAVDSKFNAIWSRTGYAGKCCKKPTVHSLRFTFVVNRINQWVKEGEDINLMIPYLSKHLGHKSVKETFYYYYYVTEANDIVRNKDRLGKSVIPEVNG